MTSSSRLLKVVIYAAIVLVGLATGVSATFNDMKYEDLLAEEAQLRIRRLKQKLNLLDDETSQEHHDLTAALNKATRELGHIRLLKKGVSSLNAMHITALQTELDAKRTQMRDKGNITPEQREDISRLAQKIQELKRSSLVSNTNTILPTGQPLDIKLDNLFDRLNHARTLEDKSEVRAQIISTRTARLKQLDEYIESDMKLIQGYRRQLQAGSLSNLVKALYNEKIDAGYETLKAHQQDRELCRQKLSDEEQEHIDRTRAYIRALRSQQKGLARKDAIAELQAKIDELSASLPQVQQKVSGTKMPSALLGQPTGNAIHEL